VAAARPAPAAPTSGLAITSLVLGILGFVTCGITAIPGLILGLVGLAKINRSGGRLGGTGLAIGGICVSGVMLLFIPIFAAMLLPALNQARGKAHAAVCIANLRQLHVVMAIYADANRNRMPDAANWCDALKLAEADEKSFRCPAAALEKCSYGFNQALSGRQWEEYPDAVVLFETDGGWNVAGDRSRMLPKPRHAGGFGILFGDGRVEVVPEHRVADLQWNPSPASP
jgi:prepilin-type processing-associated H-X9-DG protein